MIYQVIRDCEIAGKPYKDGETFDDAGVAVADVVAAHERGCLYPRMPVAPPPVVVEESKP
jgi:hypothetical protein